MCYESHHPCRHTQMQPSIAMCFVNSIQTYPNLVLESSLLIHRKTSQCQALGLDSRNSSNKHGGQRAFHRTPQFALLADWTSEDRISKESWLFQLPMWNLIFNDNHQSNVEFDNSQTKLLSFSGWPKRLTHDRHKHECENSKLELRSTTGYLSGTSRGLHHLA